MIGRLKKIKDALGNYIYPITVSRAVFMNDGSDLETKIININTQIDSSNIRSVMTDLENPFKKTRIKTLGDSITEGGGSTDSVQPKGYVKYLNNLISTNYNKEFIVPFTDNNIKTTTTVSEVANSNTIFNTTINLTNTSSGNGFEFTFYGNHFSVFYTKNVSLGIAEIYVDNVKNSDLDMYSNAVSYKNETQITGLTTASHTVKILECNRKNVSSTGNTLIFEALKIPKTADVMQAGHSGYTGQQVYEKLNSSFQDYNITANDNIVLIQIGTNDALSYTLDITKWYITEIIKHATSLGCKVVVMSSNPGVVSYDSNGSRKFKLHELDTMLRRIAYEQKVPFISNYDAFIRYATYTGVTIDSLLADTVHPNDTGYKVMADNIMRNLGLSIPRDGMTY